MVVLAPAVLGLLALAIAAGRFEAAASTVDGASAAAARAASLARTPGQAERDATSVAAAALDDQSLHCHQLSVTVDATGFQIPPTRVIQTGTPAQVGATVTCQLDLSQLLVPGLPGTKTITGSARSVLDIYRATP